METGEGLLTTSMEGVQEEKPVRAVVPFQFGHVEKSRTCLDGSQKNTIDLQVPHKSKNGQIGNILF